MSKLPDQTSKCMSGGPLQTYPYSALYCLKTTSCFKIYCCCLTPPEIRD